MKTLTLPGGIYPPVPTFFASDESLDLATLRDHIDWLTGFPLAGVLALGSNGEAMHLDDAERATVIATVRGAIDAAQHSGRARDWKLLAGTADLTTRGTLQRCRQAADSGADVAVVLPPFAFPAQMNAATLRAHFLDVAEGSPLPLLIYNMPANAGGIDLSADLLLELSAHDNIIGVKDSSGNIVKLAQVAAGVPAGFAVLAGSGSFLVPALAVGGTGAITAVANVVPAVVLQVWQQWQQQSEHAQPAVARAAQQSAQRWQGLIIPANQCVTTLFGVPGLKAALDHVRGYGGIPRRPLRPLDATQSQQIATTFDALLAQTE